MDYFKKYETERLYLCCLNDSEGQTALNYYLENRERIRGIEPEYTPMFYTRSFQAYLLRCCLENYQNKIGMCLWIYDKEDPSKPIGDVSLSDLTRLVYQSASMGYKINAGYEGKGYAYEAVSKGLEIAFEEFDLQRVEVTVLPENIRSKKLAERLGFKYEGVRRSYMYIGDAWRDHEVYSILRPNSLPPLHPLNE